VSRQRILVVGAGHVGLYAALRLSKKLRASEAEVLVVDPQPHMTYQPFLPEAAAGNISPRHSVVPLRRELRRCVVLAATLAIRVNETSSPACCCIWHYPNGSWKGCW